jgi:hypothetical protein
MMCNPPNLLIGKYVRSYMDKRIVIAAIRRTNGQILVSGATSTIGCEATYASWEDAYREWPQLRDGKGRECP